MTHDLCERVTAINIGSHLMCCSVLQSAFVAVCCSVHVLQCVAVCMCCSVLQCVAVCCSVHMVPRRHSTHLYALEDVVGFRIAAVAVHLRSVCCSVLQCVAVCCSVPQCVAVCCSECSSAFSLL